MGPVPKRFVPTSPVPWTGQPVAVTRVVRASDRCISAGHFKCRLEPDLIGTAVVITLTSSCVVVTTPTGMLLLTEQLDSPDVELAGLEAESVPRPCLTCGEPTPLASGRRGRRPVYCSPRCRQNDNCRSARRREARAHFKCLTCGRSLAERRATKYCTLRCSDIARGHGRLEPLPERQCALPGCDVTFVPAKEAAQCCSEAHGKKLWRLRATERGYRDPVRSVSCAACGAECLRAKASDGRRPACSSRCRSVLNHGWPRSKVPSGHPCRRSAEVVLFRPPPLILRIAVPDPATSRPDGRFISTRCSWCQAMFLVEQRGVKGRGRKQRHCSRACLKRDGKVRRSAFERRGAKWEAVSPILVYERDQWRCGICRRRINPDLGPPHPHSATIDHIVPRSKGGDHLYANVRAAHRRCNSVRSDRGVAEQLALIG